jgi:hypothetical protein
MTAAAGSYAASTATERYRDDGFLAHLVGRLWRTHTPVLFSTGLGIIVPFLTMTVARPGVALFGAVWCVIIAGSVADHPHRGRLDWLAPPLLRVTEYTFIGGLGITQGVPPALVFGFLAAIAFHHYDSAYRNLQRAGPVPAWLAHAGLGWDGRMLVVGVISTLGLLPQAYAVLAVAAWVIFIADSAVRWISATKADSWAAQVDLEGE